MRRRTTIVKALALAAAVTATGTSAAAASSHSNGAAGDRVTGSAVGGFPTSLSPDSDRLTVSAATGPGGQHPRGTVQADAGPTAPFHVAGPVTCLKISGHRASIKYRFTTAQGSAAAFKGGGVEVFIEDNGWPRNGQPVDRNAFNPPQPAGIFNTTARQCDDPNLGAYQSVRSGDYTVRGAGAGHATR